MDEQPGALHQSDLVADPYSVFEQWFAAASDTDIAEPNAMSIATSSGGEVSTRMVLMKYWDANGFVFFTNYGSRKSRQISDNPNVALLFYWDAFIGKFVLRGRRNARQWPSP